MNLYLLGENSLWAQLRGTGSRRRAEYLKLASCARAAQRLTFLTEDLLVASSCIAAINARSYKDSEAIVYLIGMLESIADTSYCPTGGSNKPSCK